MQLFSLCFILVCCCFTITIAEEETKEKRYWISNFWGFYEYDYAEFQCNDNYRWACTQAVYGWWHMYSDVSIKVKNYCEYYSTSPQCGFSIENDFFQTDPADGYDKFFVLWGCVCKWFWNRRSIENSTLLDDSSSIQPVDFKPIVQSPNSFVAKVIHNKSLENRKRNNDTVIIGKTTYLNYTSHNFTSPVSKRGYNFMNFGVVKEWDSLEWTCAYHPMQCGQALWGVRGDQADVTWRVNTHCNWSGNWCRLDATSDFLWANPGISGTGRSLWLIDCYCPGQ